MLQVLFYFILSVVVGCEKKQIHEIKVKNEYHGKLDSLIINVNSTIVAKVVDLNYGFDTTMYYFPKKLMTGHDVAIYGTLYNDGITIDSFFSFNDLNYIPPLMNIIVSNGGKLKFTFSNEKLKFYHPLVRVTRTT